ncbi:single-stranded DNA-binding protein [Chitinophaga lutea]|uniref:Single-stranded DNA-binding protein n=1 Tax=Chitinophaga lutea TaxID=2488634 RepID=A0A3N4PU32_9BACT|nr:single-stranded DNA-binding protein [Chitinophaga lutea]RPE12333.1 single-stranded DNA-binding protein [Chitinophaga lutea]
MIKLQLMGRLGQNATEHAVNGKTVINFSVAHNEKFKNAQGMQQERVVWVNCAMWEPGAVMPYLVQGKAVYLEGMPAVNLYRTNAGEAKAEMKVRVTFLQLLPDGRNGAENQELEPAVSQPADDLPF